MMIPKVRLILCFFLWEFIRKKGPIILIILEGFEWKGRAHALVSGRPPGRGDRRNAAKQRSKRLSARPVLCQGLDGQTEPRTQVQQG